MTTWKKLADQPHQKAVGTYGIEYWAIRDGKVWHQGRRLSKADAATFEILENSSFIARDVSSIYHAWSRLPKIDRDSFCRIGIHWKDRQHVYFEHETSLRELQGADPQSFRDLGGGYGADDNRAWHWGREMKHCTRSRDLQLVPRNRLYARDGANIYCDGKVLRGANHDPWRILASGFSRDDQGIYYLERKLPRADVHSWTHVHRAWSKDRHHVFHMNLVEKDIPPDGFDVAQARQRDAKDSAS